MATGGTERSYRLPKSAILRQKRAFEYLFEHGSSFRVGVLKFFYVFSIPEEYVESGVSVGFTAPKRVFKRAWQRNFLKRRMREAYRLNQHILSLDLSPSKLPRLSFLIKFQGYYAADYHRIRRDMIKGLQQLRELRREKGNTY